MPGPKTGTRPASDKVRVTIYLRPETASKLRMEWAMSHKPMSTTIEELIEERFGRKRKGGNAS